MKHNLKTFPDFYHKRCGHTHKEMVIWYEAFVKELQHLCFDREHLTNCASCKVGIWCNAPVIGSNVLGLSKEESLALIKKAMGDKYPFKGA